MFQLYPVYLLWNRHKTLIGSPDPMHANGTNKPNKPFRSKDLSTGHTWLIRNNSFELSDKLYKVSAINASVVSSVFVVE